MLNPKSTDENRKFNNSAWALLLRIMANDTKPVNGRGLVLMAYRCHGEWVRSGANELWSAHFFNGRDFIVVQLFYEARFEIASTKIAWESCIQE
jgi:hypothetical protein